MSEKILGEVIASGSELMLGRNVDTNSAWLSECLTTRGLTIARHTAVGDDFESLVLAFRRAWDEHHLTIVTGGLGPTEDDLTRKAAAETFGLELTFRPELAEWLKELFCARGYMMTDNNLRQAWLPESSLLVPNPVGTAPGFALASEKKLMVFLPGVPSEMKAMVESWLLERLRKHFPTLPQMRRTVVLEVVGLGESRVDHLIGDLIRSGSNPQIGLMASPNLVRILITAEGENELEILTLIEETKKILADKLGEHLLPAEVAST